MDIDAENRDSLDIDVDDRKQLKVKILQLQADTLQKKIDIAITEVDSMAHKYSTIMQDLLVLEGVSSGKHKKHTELLSYMVGEQKKTTNYDECNTSEEMLQMAMGDLNQVNELGKKNVDPEHGIPDVGDNTEIWDRIAKAQQNARKYDMLSNPLALKKMGAAVTEVDNISPKYSTVMQEDLPGGPGQSDESDESDESSESGDCSEYELCGMSESIMTLAS